MGTTKVFFSLSLYSTKNCFALNIYMLHKEKEKNKHFRLESPFESPNPQVQKKKYIFEALGELNVKCMVINLLN